MEYSLHEALFRFQYLRAIRSLFSIDPVYCLTKNSIEFVKYMFKLSRH